MPDPRQSLSESARETVLSATGAEDVSAADVLQSLWSGYGDLLRLQLNGGAYPSVILKYISLPEAGNHPRGWNTDLSHQRKLHSYQVEAHWYQRYAAQCDDRCAVPSCLAVHAGEHETLLLLTDLDAAGFSLRKERVELADIHACLGWLASFHATFLGDPAEGLWECGTYWHLDTRPDELAALEDEALRAAAPLIDQRLRQCRYQTLVHGDAKLANFCFSADRSRPAVAAVDFQYVGRGCGMKDVAYFIGSCLYEDDCEAMEGALLDHYFSVLGPELQERHPDVDVRQLEAEWRDMFELAWADFHRFLKGWSPGHWKLNSYSETLTRRVIERLSP